MSGGAAYALDDDGDAEEVELFYSEPGGSTVPAPGRAGFVAMTGSGGARAPGASAFSASSASAGVAQFDVEEPKRGGALGAGAGMLWKRLAPANYNAYFQLTVADLALRLSRALVPTLPLLDPPAARPPARAAEGDDDLEGGDAAGPTGVGSEAAFNGKVDLYGPMWTPTTLVLCIAVGANILVVLRALAAQSETRAVSALTALNFRHLVQAGSIVYSYTAAMTAATVVGKRYFGDETSREVDFVLCVYGYAAAPFVPAALLCAIPNAWLNWLFMLTAAAVSAYFLCINLWPPPATADATYGAAATKSARWRMRAGCVVCHILFAVVLKLRFF